VPLWPAASALRTADPVALAQLPLLIEGVGGNSSVATTAQPSASSGWAAAASHPSSFPLAAACWFAGGRALLGQGLGSAAGAAVAAAGAGDGDSGCRGQALDQVAAGSMHGGRPTSNCCPSDGGRWPLAAPARAGPAAGDGEQLSSAAVPPPALPKQPLLAGESSCLLIRPAAAAAAVQSPAAAKAMASAAAPSQLLPE
jgi:hypothetical protein